MYRSAAYEGEREPIVEGQLARDATSASATPALDRRGEAYVPVQLEAGYRADV